MNFVKRALISIRRRPLKPILLFLIIFILANVMAGALAIRQASDNVKRTIIERVPAVLKADMDYDTWQESDNEALPDPISPEVAMAIGELDYVKSYDFSIGLEVGGEGLIPFVSSNEYIQSFLPEEYSLFTLKGVQYAPMMMLEEGTDQLVSGRSFTQEEIEQGAPVAVIHQKIAQLNNKSVGDTMLVSDYIVRLKDTPNESVGYQERLEFINWGQNDIPLEIIGIYEPNPDVHRQTDVPIQQRTNFLYVPNQLIIDEMARKKDMALALDVNLSQVTVTGFGLGEHIAPIYLLKSPYDMEKFTQEALALLPEFYYFKTNTDSLQAIAGSVEQMSNMSGSILLLAAGATITVLTLVVMLFLRDRKQELGIYLSLGEAKSKITGQIMLEVLIVTVLAISLSVFTGNLMADRLSDSMVQDELSLSEELKQLNASSSEYIDFGGFAARIDQEVLIENYQIGFSASYFLWFYLVGLITIGLAGIIPTMYILHLSPKKILM